LGAVGIPLHPSDLLLYITLSQFSTDLIRASKLANTPSCTRAWNIEPLFFRSTALQHPLKGSCVAPGRAFFTRLSAALPARCIKIMIRLATMNHLMCVSSAQLHTSSAIVEQNSKLLVTMRAVQHDLLSLPDWGSLDNLEQGSSHEGVYGCCRLTAIIYSNAVLIDIPPQCGWHTKLAHRLRLLLEHFCFGYWPAEFQCMLVWTLCVGVLAAPRSADHTFFEDALRELLGTMCLISSRKSVESILGEFMWSQEACKHGAAMLWSAL
jgi:hypothetical protein